MEDKIIYFWDNEDVIEVEASKIVNYFKHKLQNDKIFVMTNEYQYLNKLTISFNFIDAKFKNLKQDELNILITECSKYITSFIEENKIENYSININLENIEFDINFDTKLFKIKQ